MRLGSKKDGGCLAGAAKQASKGKTRAAAATTPTVTASLVLNPLGEKLAIGELPAVGDLGSGLGLAGVEAEERGYGSDHVGHGQAVGAGRHDVGAVKLYGGESHATLVLAYAGLDQRANQRLHGTAGRAPGGSPQRQERDA